MSPYKRKQQKRTCARCGRFGSFCAVWPDGSVCRGCECRALRVRGECPGCGEHRALPGVRPGDGTAICTQCAGFRPSYVCSRCGEEDQMHARHLCTRCTLSDRLSEALDDGTGRIRPELEPLHAMLVKVDNPRTLLTWLYGYPPKVVGAAVLLRQLGRGEVALTHEAFHRLQPWRGAAHLRDLLMSCDLLPTVDKQICMFEHWLVRHLDGMTDPAQEQLVRRFATWDILPRLRARAERKRITPASCKGAGEQVRAATAFLGWLTARDLDLADCSQADIDIWHVEHKQHERVALRRFLLWCMDNKSTRRFDLRAAQTNQRPPLTHSRRVDLLGQILTNTETPLRSRVAAGLLLLFAQPASRIVQLTTEDVIQDQDQVLLRLGEPPLSVPEPFASMLLDYTASRTNMRTATNPGSTWLFPGRRANQPLHQDYLAKLMGQLGVPTVAGRTAAIRQHVLELPAPIVADALSYHPVTTTKLATRAGTTWSRYAPGDHSSLKRPGIGDT
ncbi:hypothetical protein D5S17_35565 [Pseudonocardiaceae bacterium YIM PH 21723]|nr:hypothetical protein D5S17_35565 [Pseudonocardiaceae bacterium YIM PH 21723]